MRRLFGSTMCLALLAALWVGCGSTADDRLVLRFIRFDNEGITQSDTVSENTADVDIVQNCCLASQGGDQGGTQVNVEPFTRTIINAVFSNEEASDIRVERYNVDLGPNSGLGIFTKEMNGVVVGGRCSNVDRQCAVDADCIVGTAGGTCEHTETRINAILLFDFTDKVHVLPGTYNVKVTFFGSDANQSFQTEAGYVVTFANFNNCPSGQTPIVCP